MSQISGQTSYFCISRSLSLDLEPIKSDDFPIRAYTMFNLVLALFDLELSINLPLTKVDSLLMIKERIQEYKVIRIEDVRVTLFPSFILFLLVSD